MNKTDSDRWKAMLLDEILKGLATSPELREALVFKGARVLNALLNTQRQSLDIDSNLTFDFARRIDDRDRQRMFLAEQLGKALRFYFSRQDPQRFAISSLEVQLKPPTPHPWGWNAFLVRVRIEDRQKMGVLGLPALEIDIAAPEQLSPTSAEPLVIGTQTVNAYSLERIAGEKHRAFLTSLPAYRHKLNPGSDRVPRVKDLYDLVRIFRHRGAGAQAFWKSAAQEFRLACESRFVDCEGLPTFHEGWEMTRSNYAKAVRDGVLPNDVGFSEVETVLEQTVGLFEKHGVIPCSFPLPHVD
jgi:hypothetical protein